MSVAPTITFLVILQGHNHDRPFTLINILRVQTSVSFFFSGKVELRPIRLSEFRNEISEFSRKSCAAPTLAAKCAGTVRKQSEIEIITFLLLGKIPGKPIVSSNKICKLWHEVLNVMPKINSKILVMLNQLMMTRFHHC